MEYTEEEIEEWKNKAEMWDSLDDEISEYYGEYDEENDEFEFEPSLQELGKTVASKFNYID